jgi:oxygen-independent coproporphyrinogen-3 oxidase
MKNKRALIQSLLREIELSRDYLEKKTLDTLYFGGGTPSVLQADELGLILSQLKKYYHFAQDMEFTLEANPDDLTPASLAGLRRSGVNRLSIGIQSFHQDELDMMNRSHDVKQASDCIIKAKAAGFYDLSIDLIFAMPGSDLKKWAESLEKALSFDVPHYSIYNLTVEAKTALHHFIQSGRLENIEEGAMAEQFLFSIDQLERAGYEHYEISNYAKDGKYAKHNTSYWQGESYLGLGPSAHSFNHRSRRWNVANNARYIKAINENRIPYESEILSRTDQYNEYVLTGLRTQWGCDLDRIAAFGEEYLSHFIQLAAIEVDKKRLHKEKTIYTLSRQGKLFADELSSTLFFS